MGCLGDPGIQYLTNLSGGFRSLMQPQIIFQVCLTLFAGLNLLSMHSNSFLDGGKSQGKYMVP